MPLLHEGRIIRDTYEVERFLGEGAFAEVYRVKHRWLGRQAMKVFKTAGMTLGEMEELLQEAILLSRLGHPNVVRVFEANTLEAEDSTRAFFTMEFVAGGSVERFWSGHGQRFVPTETAVEILRQACRGLAVAHGESPPIVHRDVKPANLLVGYGPAGLHVRVSDFGLAKRVNPLTLLASARGTLAFKAPESLADPQADSPAGDVWALGCTLHLLLTDRLPTFARREGDAVGVATGSLEPPSQWNVLADASLDRIVAKALAPRPADRYRDAGALLADLERWSPGGAVAVERAAPVASPARDETKGALGRAAVAVSEPAEETVARAMAMSRVPRRLAEAADLLEEALNRQPSLRESHEHTLRLWRRGVLM